MRASRLLPQAISCSQLALTPAAADTLPSSLQQHQQLLCRAQPACIAQHFSRSTSNGSGSTQPDAPSRTSSSSAGSSGTPPPTTGMGQGISAAATAREARSRVEAAPGAQANLGFMASKQANLSAVPPLPKFLGFAGAIPFLALSPLTLESLQMNKWIDTAASAQVTYGAIICSFLGAVHWGAAMSSVNTLSGGPKAAAALNERYMFSVVPSLAAWPIIYMQTGPASLAAAFLLGICYLSDKSYFRLGMIPQWYMTLRGWLTTLAVLGCVSTFLHYISAEKRQEEAEKAAAASVAAVAEDEARLAAAMVEQAAPVVESSKPKKKGWFW